MLKISYVRQEAGKYFVYSETGKKLSKGYDSESEANNRLRQIEYFKKLKKTTKTAEVFESKKKQKPWREHLPYRVRIEVVATGPDNTVYGGVYDDGTFGLYGGGASDNDNGTGGYLKDGIREFLEETGYQLTDAVMCDVEPVTEEWVELPKDASDKFKERFPQFRGSRTYFIRGTLPDKKAKDKAKGEDGKVPFKKVKLYPAKEALEMLSNLPKDCAAPSACKGRKAAIREATEMKKEAGLSSLLRKLIPITKAKPVNKIPQFPFRNKLRLKLTQEGFSDKKDLPDIALGRKLRRIKQVSPELFEQYSSANAAAGLERSNAELLGGGFKQAGLSSLFGKLVRPLAKASDAVSDATNGVDGLNMFSSAYKAYGASRPAFDFARTAYTGRRLPSPTGFKTKLGPVMRRGQSPFQAGLGATKDLFRQTFKSAAEVLPGGLGDNKPDTAFPKDKLQEGIEEEAEHTDNKQVQKEIAKDHLTEDKRYYDKLKLVMGS